MESPQKIGKFRVLRLLGQGAMGRVFLAEDPLIDRRVAIKVMTAEGDDEARERFRNEARTAGQLSHPNIVQLYEFGFHQGQPYLVMEYLVGQSLDLWLAGKQPLKARLSVLLDLCRAIGHAHARGVLHRDVKPSNLQVLPDGACKLMDFGIARSHSVRLTATGMILGTPEFIAPEVLQDAGHSDRSDLFAVGLVAYQVLAGVSPFHASTLEGCLARVLTYQPPPLVEVCPDVPAELSDVISSYLRKAPAERPADVRPLMATLHSLQDRTLRLASDPTPATAPPAAPTPQPQVASEAPTIRGPVPSPARDRRLLPAAALLTALVAVASLAATMSWRPWSRPDPVAEITANPSVGAPPERPSPAAADAQPAGETGPQDDGDAAGTSPASASPPARPPPETPLDSSAAAGRMDIDPGTAAAESTTSDGRDPVASPVAPPRVQAETAPADDPAVSEPDPPPVPGATESAASLTEPAATADRPSGEGDPPSSQPPAAHGTPRETSTREPSTGAASGGAASGGAASAGEPSTGEPAPEPPAVEPSPAAPRIDRLEPAVVRRGSTVALVIFGSGFDRGTKAVVRRGSRPVRALRIRVEGTSELRVTLLVDRQLPLGTYTVTVVDAGGRVSNSIGLEVGL